LKLKTTFLAATSSVVINGTYRWRFEMPDTKNTEEPKRPEGKNTGTADVYNPVNMAGKTAESNEEQDPEDDPLKDDYNPVNMAGKKAPLSRE
jgi:hypothetical protein